MNLRQNSGLVSAGKGYKPAPSVTLAGSTISNLTGTMMPTATLIGPSTAKPDYRNDKLGSNPGFAPQSKPYVSSGALSKGGDKYVAKSVDLPKPQGSAQGGVSFVPMPAREYESDSTAVSGGASKGYNTPSTKGGMTIGKQGEGYYPPKKTDNHPSNKDQPGPLAVFTDGGNFKYLLLVLAAYLAYKFKG